ncbi:hypothetical protein ACFYXD_15720 [Streptomyces platensis]
MTDDEFDAFCGISPTHTLNHASHSHGKGSRHHFEDEIGRTLDQPA